MKKRTFLSMIAGYLCSLVRSDARVPLIYIWVEEESEIFCGPSVQAISDFFDFSSEEPLTAENCGELWGYCSETEWADQVRPRSWFKRVKVAQLASQYT